MNPHAINLFRHKLAADAPVCGLWVTLESPSITEMAVGLGLDWVVIDAEHGHLDWQEIAAHIRAAVRSETIVLVRIAGLDAMLTKRALDIGADGVIVPWIETAEQARAAARFAMYPPEGVRGIGAERATCWGECMAEHTAEANEHVLVVPLIETVTAGRNIRAIAAVDGLNVFFFGPHDYSSTAGFRGRWEGPGVADELLRIRDVIRGAGKHCGIMTRGADDLRRRREQGFRMLGLASDTGLILRGLHQALAGIGQDRRMNTGFSAAQTSVAPPLRRPPEVMRPDRREVITPCGAGNRMSLASGVILEAQVGRHNQARNLMTGIVTFAPGASLPYHRHPCGESITVLFGELLVEVEGRRYHLREMDNIVTPAGLAHAAVNASPETPAKAHVALASAAPERSDVQRDFAGALMPDDCSGVPGAERVNRFKTAQRFEAGPNAVFIDFFNEDLVPGIKMSGGHGLFQPGGRLPAHVHDFDESICIVAGVATCVVEGRHYSMRECATALQPRGRVHYFKNESEAPMVMLWVYAGPKPERIVVDERCATVEGDPWKPRGWRQ